MNIIPILPGTIALITALNNGVSPEITREQTYYVWTGVGGHSHVITYEEYAAIPWEGFRTHGIDCHM